MRKLLCLAAGLLLGAPTTALAGVITIDFDLASSTIGILGGAISIPPEGNITASGATVQFNGSGLEAVQAGGVILRSVAFNVTISGDVGTGAFLTGSVGAGQVGQTIGNLTAGLSQAVFLGSLILNVSGTLDCTGLGCGFLGSFPTSIAGPQTYTNLGTFAVANINSSGAALFSGTLSFTLAGLTAVMNLTGAEVNRTFVVPEPNTAGLLALGLLGLASGGWLCRSRRD